MTMNIHPVLKGMLPMVEGISKTFGKNCEVVLHELKESRKSIIAIYNGHVTGRTIGSTMLDVGIEALRQGNKTDNILNYKNKTNDGRILKSSTMFIRDDKNSIIGCLCINVDISDIIIAQKSLESFFETDREDDTNLNQFTNSNVNDVLINITADTLDSLGKPVSYMNKEDKVAVVKKLDMQGAFLIKGAIDYVAKILCVSRYTIYNYLDEIRANEQ